MTAFAAEFAAPLAPHGGVRAPVSRVRVRVRAVRVCEGRGLTRKILKIRHFCRVVRV
jgi:hypothetical protein